MMSNVAQSIFSYPLHHYPVDLQQEILRKLEWSDLCHLRATCNTEKAIVDHYLPTVLKNEAKDIKTLIEKHLTMLQNKYITLCENRRGESSNTIEFDQIARLFNQFASKCQLVLPNLILEGTKTIDFLFEVIKQNPNNQSLARKTFNNKHWTYWAQDSSGLLNVQEAADLCNGALIAMLTNLKIFEERTKAMLTALQNLQ